MISNERKIGKLAYSKGYPSSSTLRDSANEMIQIRKKLRYERIQPRKSIERINILQERYEDKKKQHKENQRNSEKLREEDLDRLAAKRAEQWKIKASQAIIVIKASEESRKLPYTKNRESF